MLTWPESVVITKQNLQWSVSSGLTALVWDWQTFLVKGQRVNIFGFAGHMCSVSNTRLCHSNARQLQAMCKHLGRAVFCKTISKKRWQWAALGPWSMVFGLLIWTFHYPQGIMGEQTKTLKTEKKKVYILYPYLSFCLTKTGRFNALLARQWIGAGPRACRSCLSTR